MPRSNQTKHLLAQSLQELMATTPLEKISVNDIVDHAGVGRNTFYYHFEDIYDLLRWLCSIEAEQVMRLQDSSVSWEESFGRLLNYLSENKSFCLSLLNSVEHRYLKNILTDYMQALTKKAIYSELAGLGKDVEAKIREKQDIFDFNVTFYSQAAASMMESKLLGDIQLSNEKFIEYMEFVIENNLRGIAAMM